MLSKETGIKNCLNKLIINGRFLTRRITGVERYAIGISSELAKYDDLSTIISPRNIGSPDILNRLIYKKLGITGGHLWEQLEFPVFLSLHGKPLTLNLCNTAPMFYSNQIVTIHDLGFIRNSSWYSKSFSMLYKILIPKIAHHCKAIITVSDFSRKEISSILNVPIEKITVAPSAVSPEFIIETNRTPSENTYGKYIIAVSSIDPRKNFPSVIQAYDKLNLPNTKLLIVGVKNKVFGASGLPKTSLSNPNIIFTGFVSDQKLISLYKHALLFVYPSYYEGFGLPPLESMACGCPVLVSDIPPHHEACGQAAVFVSPNNIDDIASKIYSLVNNEQQRRKMIDLGFKNVKRFSFRQSAHNIYNIIKQIQNENTH